MNLVKKPALLAVALCLFAQLHQFASADNEKDNGSSTCAAGEMNVTNNNVKGLHREVAQIAEVAMTDGLDPDVQRETCDSIQGIGFIQAKNNLLNKGYNLVNVYEKINCKVSLKKPNLVGFFILEISNIGKYFNEFKDYYEKLSVNEKSVLRNKIKSEKNIDKYLKQAREHLKENFENNDGPKYRTYIAYLDTIESWLNSI